MRLVRLLPSLALCLLPLTLSAQHEGGGAKLSTQPPKEASQYDFLIGQWELTVTPKAVTLGQKIHGTPKLRGTWKGWRAMDGWGIEDELRIVDPSGNPVALTHFTRLFDAAGRQWVLSAADAYRGRVTNSTATFDGTGFHTSATASEQDGKAIQTRSHITKITASSFRFEQERSEDGGKSWTTGWLVIDAKRTAAAVAR